jgi:hypothetical protein
MTYLAGVLLSLLVSYGAVMMPRGISPRMPEFWLTPWLYGLPVLVLAWPVYFQVFKRLPRLSWWQLGLVGAALSPLAFAMLIIGDALFRGALPDQARPVSFYLPWNSVFTYWYALFGFLLGGYVGLGRRLFQRSA